LPAWHERRKVRRMQTRFASLALGAALLGAAAYAFYGPDRSPAVSRAGAQENAGIAPPEDETFGPDETTLPPGHPSIGAAEPSTQGSVVPAPDPGDAPLITWQASKEWESVPNPNAMRIATYRVPASHGGEPAELSITRAGGSNEANIQRWLGQFGGADQEKRSTKNVGGLPVTVIEVTGTYLGSGMTDTSGTKRPNVTLVAAIVETPGSPYFFKLLGPAATVREARRGFDALLGSIAPVPR